MKRIITNKVLIQIVLIIVLSSCKTIYRANKLNTPVFKTKKELQATLVTGASGIELQGAYSINDNIAVMLNGVYDNSKVRVMDTIQQNTVQQSVKDISSEYSNVYGEGAIGYYQSFGVDTSKMAAIYVGGGLGATNGYSNHWGVDYLKYNSEYFRLFVQPTYGLILSRNVELAAAIRFSFMNYHSLDVMDTVTTFYSTNRMDVFVDPAVTLKLGFDQFKFVAQAGSSLPLLMRDYYTSSTLILSFGFHLNFTRYWEKPTEYYDQYE